MANETYTQPESDVEQQMYQASPRSRRGPPSKLPGLHPALW